MVSDCSLSILLCQIPLLKLIFFQLVWSTMVSQELNLSNFIQLPVKRSHDKDGYSPTNELRFELGFLSKIPVNLGTSNMTYCTKALTYNQITRRNEQSKH